MAVGTQEAVCGAVQAFREQTGAEETTAGQGLSRRQSLGAEGSVLPPRPESPAEASAACLASPASERRNTELIRGVCFAE